MTIQISRRHLTLLIADEGNEIQAGGLQKLDDRDVKVVMVRKVSQLFDYFDQQIPDFVILNILNLDVGLDVCAKLRSHYHAWDIPIIAIINDQQPSSIEAYYRANASDVIIPPITDFNLYWRIKNWLVARNTFENLFDKSKCLSMAQSIAQLGYWQWDLDHDEFTLSRSLYSLFGINLKDCQQSLSQFMDRIHPLDREHVKNEFLLAQQEMRGFEVEHRIIGIDNKSHIVSQTVTPMEVGQSIKMLGVIQDITEKKRAEEMIVSLSYYDNLTGLPNKDFLKQHLNYVLEYSQRNNKTMALLSLGLDQFTRVNSSLGNYHGDRVLAMVGERFGRVLRRSDFISRVALKELDCGIEGGGSEGHSEQGNLCAESGVDSGAEKSAVHLNQKQTERTFEDIENNSHEGPLIGRIYGDTYHIILSEILRPVDAARVAKRLQESMEEPFEIDGQQVILTASIGIAIYPYNGIAAEELMTNADTAQEQAKCSGRNCYNFFSQELNDSATSRLRLEGDLRKALHEQQFELYFQPKIDIQNRTICGAEALLRWQKSERGFVSPLEFIPLCEQIGLIKPLGKWVLEEACRIAKMWQIEKPGLRVSVNVSSIQLDEFFLENTKSALNNNNLPPGLLDIEITEGVFLENKERVSLIFAELRRLGVTISIDDFGTGFSSLSYLSELPVDTLKIDRSFLNKINQDEGNKAIVEAVLTLAKGISLKTVAEGVEEYQQLQYLIDHQCEEIQGYLFSKPLPPDDFIEWLCTEQWSHIFDKKDGQGNIIRH